MAELRDKTAEVRANTDAKLGAERASTDGEEARLAARSQRIYDDLIERDRMLADARLQRFRDRADRIVSVDRAAWSTTGRSTRMERLVADQGIREERAAADGLLELERTRADATIELERSARAAHHEGHVTRRQETDARLLNERSEADAAVIDLEKTKGALAQLRGEQARRTDLLGVVAHELRSPLSVVVLNGQLLTAGSETPALRDAAADVVCAAARMERLLADLLDVTRMQGGGFRVVKDEHDLGTLLVEVQRTYAPFFAARQLSFWVEVPPPGTLASFDHDRIVQVLSNLLGNAMKFTPTGGTVHLDAVLREGAPLEIVLRNSGPGISATALPHVFDRFWQLDADTTRGLGLGLFICKTIVEAHGGRIRAESGLGDGATFRFTLPDA
jgi:signal transduction histidine kinase